MLSQARQILFPETTVEDVMGNITSMVVLYVGSCKFHRNYVSVSSIIYISFFNHIYVSFCKLPYIFCKDIDKKQNYRLLFYILDRFKLILLNVCYIKLLFRFSAAHLWHNMFAIKHVWMQTCLIANTFIIFYIIFLIIILSIPQLFEEQFHTISPISSTLIYGTKLITICKSMVSWFYLFFWHAGCNYEQRVR